MTFTQWLETQQERDDPIGDFARDALEDLSAPTGVTSFTDWSDHLARMRADLDAVQAMKMAWVTYLEECGL